ncbi:uncharacterized protein [Primulina huaijiensis]|uniref:uncharacterized protein n=1 Tax=Primulina huaijiensis TaxID=1492673 RepID=UPI003CC70121
MSDRVVQSVSETSGRSVQPMQTYQSLWMSHWIRASCKATAETLNLATGKGPAVTETRTSEMMDDSTKMGTERLGFGSSIFKLNRKTDDMQVRRAVIDRNFERGKCVDVNRGTQFPSMLRGVPLDEGTSKNPLEWMKDRPSADESGFVAMKPSQETFAEPSSLDVLYKHDLGKYESRKGKSGVSSLICGGDVSKNLFESTNLRVQEHISCNKHSQSADLVCQENKDSLSQSKNLMNACFRESNASLLFDIPSTSHNHLPTFNQEWFQKIQKCSDLRPYPDHYIVSEETEAKKSYYNSYSLQKLPNCLHNVETMRICTTMEKANLRGFPGFSQTSHSLLITKTTDFNLSNEFDIFDGTRVITETNGNMAGQGNRGVILQQLSSSAESERKGQVGDVKTGRATINNESSAETDTMDMDYFKEKNPYSGANSSPSDKAFNMYSSLSYPVDVFSSREAKRQGPNTKLPDINLEPPALPAAAASSENSGPSSSKTQSLEMDMLMAHAEPSKPNSNLSPEDSREADPGNRWVKRLKLSSSQSSSRGTKSSDLAGNSHDKKMKKHFGRILTNGILSSEPYSRKHHGKVSVALDNKGSLIKQNTEITVSPSKKSMELLLSQPWIQRWLHDESRSSTQEYTETTAVCAPQSSKLAMKNHQKEQFPSIGAMALMGKAVRGFQPCDLQKRGSFTVWNTKTI